MNTVRIKRFFTQSPMWQSWTIILLFLLGSVALIYFTIEPTERQLILHDTIPYGIDLVGPWWRLYEIPIAGLALVLINGTLSYFLFIRQRTVAIALIIMTALFELMMMAGVYLLINQNVQ